MRLMIELRPPLRWAEFTTRLFAGEYPADLPLQFTDEIVSPARD